MRGATALLLLAGAIGAVVRFAVEAAVERRSPAVPWGVVAVNLAGSAVLGGLVALAGQGRVSPTVLLIAGAGFCGAVTTFSAFAFSAVQLVEGSPRRGGVFITGMVVGCGLAAAFGTAVAGVL
jgi:fluoride exporter